MKRYIIQSLIFLFSAGTLFSQERLSGNALLVNLNGYVVGMGPYTGGGGSLMAKYEFKSTGENAPILFPSVGAGVLGTSYGGGIIFPIECNAGFDFKWIGLYTSIGGIVNTEGGYLHPAILPTLHGITRFKFVKSRFFLDLEYRFIAHYQYEGRLNGQFKEPFERVGWGGSVGAGISIGRYLSGKKRMKEEKAPPG